jgi:hypothetical protein
MILALLLCVQDTVEMKDFKSSYAVVKPAAYTDRSSWPVVIDLGNPKDPAREPRCFVLTPGERRDESFLLACLLDLKTKYRIHPDRVIVRGGSAALALAVGHPELIAACAIRRPLAFSPPKKAPFCVLFVSARDPDRIPVLAAAMVMKKNGIRIDVREASAEPDEIADAVDARLRPGTTVLRAMELEEQGRWLDASLVCIDVAERDTGEQKAAASLLRNIDGKAIIELAKVEVASSERKYKDAVLRCRSAARQFAWVPTGAKIRKRLAELESRPEVMKALETDD